ncbi:hypothetical protein ANCDUO_08966 [Ancylostoma duodenale]|uniref:Uncharacterized protein n=1 Tax=Ancylostoma duodenale TaxID=51022 RepID=A0A0C2GUC7_9BILA|nr:hypothetical protein ANCDUO_08966 [Ancylostoma duodenale]
MRMLRWMGGITQLDRICNQDVQQRFGVVAIADKLREARLRWRNLHIVVHIRGASGASIYLRRWIYEPDGFLRIKPDDELIRSTDVWQIQEVLKNEVSASRSSAR